MEQHSKFTIIKEWLILHKRIILLSIYTILFLVCGTMTTIISKTTMTAEGQTKDGKWIKFERPMFFNLLMFLGMSIALLFHYINQIISSIKQWRANRNKPIFSDENQTLKNELVPNENENQNKLTWKEYLFMALPSLCDFFSTYLVNFGLLYIPSSVHQMMRGSTIIFAMLLAIFWRKQKQYMFHYVGAGSIVIALVIVGCSMFIPTGHENKNNNSSESSQNEDEESGHAWYMSLVGIVLIIISQVLHAVQTIIEEIFTHDIKASVSFVVGLRGVYGCIFCVIVLVAYYFMDFLPDAIREDFVDTFHMIGSSDLIITLIIFYIIVIYLFNYAGTACINYGNAMMKNILEPMRMITVWIVSVFIYYAISEEFGESLGYNTIVQVIGFVLLTFGFFLYTKIIKIRKWFYYPDDNESKFIELEGEVKMENANTSSKEINIEDDMNGKETLPIGNLPKFDENEESSSSSSDEIDLNESNQNDEQTNAELNSINAVVESVVNDNQNDVEENDNGEKKEKEKKSSSSSVSISSSSEENDKEDGNILED